MVSYISHSPAETEALGEEWGRSAQSGLVIGLCGDLGAGKTQLVKGLARGLGTPSGVHSPTFSLVNVYPGGRLTLFHLDVYRLDSPAQITSAGLEEYLRPEGVTVIEWADKWLGEVRSVECGVRSAECGVGDAARISAPYSALRTPHSAFPTLPPLRWVQIESLSQTERRITYEDTGA
jgi:tRNA threonylcarbamoyladenosine biosynthesis protein TsaE